MRETEIRIRNARSHNLAGVDCRFPLGRLTVVTGVSGSGKSTLAFDTLYAEGQRRFVTSLSTYARQFLERLPRPEVDSISNLPPAIAIEQRNRVTNARSTVGTATEILDHLRLLFARIGETECPDCRRIVPQGGVLAVADRVARRFAGQRVTLGAPLSRRRGERAEAMRERLAQEGFTRILGRDGEISDLTALSGRAFKALVPDGLLLLDRLALDPEPASGAGEGASVRLTEAVATAFAQGEGELVVVPRGEPGDAERVSFREGFLCDGCGRSFKPPEPSLFSFNSPLGACQACQGFGRVAELDLDRVVPDPTLSLAESAVAPFATPTGRAMQRDLLDACAALGIPTEVAFEALSEQQRQLVIDGDGEDWYGVRGYFDWLEGRRYKVQARVAIARYRRFARCPVCQGARLCSDALAVHVAGENLAAVSRRSVGELLDWVRSLSGEAISPAARARAQRLLLALETRVATVAAVGLEYLGVDRQVRTLSGGEAQRIQLASALGGGLTAALYVLDEPTIGLHPRDMDRLIGVILAIRDQGNTVVVVEHAPELLLAADHVIDLGPGAGRHGGRLLVEGTLAAVRECDHSPTGALLRGQLDLRRAGPARRREPSAWLRIRGARENNLQNLDVDVPLGLLVVVTGVSGAGKSTLVRSVLVGNLDRVGERRRGMEPGACDGIEGAEAVQSVVVVDQSPSIRSPRSNPATVSKAFDVIRQRFAATREARALGVGPGWFSFNVPGGRCDACEGAGEVVIDMQFLDDVRAPCDQCGGLRYRRDVLEVRLDGRSIVDVLELTLEEAVEVFASERKIVERLEPFLNVGLGYLRLGQPLSTLSGGEHQRVRLALALGEGRSGRLYVLDEPTTGLHTADIAVLMRCLDSLLEQGGSIVMIEHNVDVMLRADHIIDIGPEGGPDGGRLVASGSPEEVAATEMSHTGRALRARLGAGMASSG